MLGSSRSSVSGSCSASDAATRGPRARRITAITSRGARRPASTCCSFQTAAESFLTCSYGGCLLKRPQAHRGLRRPNVGSSRVPTAPPPLTLASSALKRASKTGMVSILVGRFTFSALTTTLQCPISCSSFSRRCPGCACCGAGSLEGAGNGCQRHFTRHIDDASFTFSTSLGRV